MSSDKKSDFTSITRNKPALTLSATDPKGTQVRFEVNNHDAEINDLGHGDIDAVVNVRAYVGSEPNGTGKVDTAKALLAEGLRSGMGDEPDQGSVLFMLKERMRERFPTSGMRVAIANKGDMLGFLRSNGAYDYEVKGRIPAGNTFVDIQAAVREELVNAAQDLGCTVETDRAVKAGTKAEGGWAIGGNRNSPPPLPPADIN